MAKLPHTRAEMRVFYPVFRRRKLAAGWRYMTLKNTGALSRPIRAYIYQLKLYTNSAK
jgi:hypothetical protein